jgi:hypothetical protein
MLVKLYTLPELAPPLDRLKALGIDIRQADPDEKHILADWVRLHFQESWALGCEVALEQRPVCCYLAIEKGAAPVQPKNAYDLPAERLVGFACYDVASKGMFGPMGVREDYQGRGIGTGLLLQDINPERIAGTLTSAYEAQPQNFEQLLGTPNVGPKTIRALALLSEVIHGARPSFRDLARFSFAHGGKDGHPYPVDRQTYDQSIHILKEAVQRAKVGERDRLEAIKRLNRLAQDSGEK